MCTGYSITAGGNLTGGPCSRGQPSQVPPSRVYDGAAERIGTVYAATPAKGTSADYGTTAAKDNGTATHGTTTAKDPSATDGASHKRRRGDGGQQASG